MHPLGAEVCAITLVSHKAGDQEPCGMAQQGPHDDNRSAFKDTVNGELGHHYEPSLLSRT